MQVFTPSIGLKLLVGGLTALCGLFVLGACVGAIFDLEALLVAGLFGVLGLLMLWVSFRTFRWVSLDEQELVYGGIFGRTRIQLADIESIELGHALRIRAAGSWKVAIRMEQRGKLGELTQALRKRLPGAFQRRTALPFRWRPRGMVLGINLFYVGFTLFMGSIGCFAGLDGVRALWLRHWGDALRMGGMGMLMSLVGFGMLTMILTQTLLWVQFGPDRIVARYPVRWKTFRVPDLREVAVRSEQRTYKGIPRTAWFLELDFAQGRTLRIEPTENGVSGEWASAADQDEVTALRDDLVQLYGVSGG